MDFTKVFSILTTLALAAFLLIPAAKADNWNEMTRLTFSAPVQVPGHVLPAGTYWFKLANLQSNRNVVEIFSLNWSQHYDTVITVPEYRRTHLGRTELKFAERRHDQPEALVAWFYPGRMTGHEFLYPQQVEKKLNRDHKQKVFVPVLKSRNFGS